MDIKLKSKKVLLWFQDDRLTFENQADYLSKLYSLHENLNQQTRKYVNETVNQRKAANPISPEPKAIATHDPPTTTTATIQISNSNKLSNSSLRKSLSTTTTTSSNAPQQYLSNSTFSFFRKNNPSQLQTIEITNGAGHNSRTNSELSRYGGGESFASNSIISLNAQKINFLKIDTLLEQRKMNKSNFDEVIGGKQMLAADGNSGNNSGAQQVYSYPIIANAKIEYPPHRLKPINSDSVNRIKKMLNLEDISTANQNTLLQQQQQAHQNNGKNNTNTSHHANIKLRLRESRVRHSLKTVTAATTSTTDKPNAQNTLSSSSSAAALVAPSTRSLTKREDSNETLSSKQQPSQNKLPQISKRNEFRYPSFNNSNNLTRKNSKSSDDSTLTSMATISQQPTMITISGSAALSIINNDKQQQQDQHGSCAMCQLCAMTSGEKKKIKKEFQPIITILTTSKPQSPLKTYNNNNSNSNTYVQFNSSAPPVAEHILYKQTSSSYMNYKSPAPSPEVFI